MNFISIRGAITADNNKVDDISDATIELFQEIIEKNDLVLDDIINIQLSITKDLNAINPAKILRENFDLKYTPLFCTQEADMINALERAIRILILTKSDLNKKNVKHIYLKNAKNLRPDL